MTDPLAAACHTFADALARIGVDPNRATIVLEPRDMSALQAARPTEVCFELRPQDDAVRIGALTFLRWRHPTDR